MDKKIVAGATTATLVVISGVLFWKRKDIKNYFWKVSDDELAELSDTDKGNAEAVPEEEAEVANS